MMTKFKQGAIVIIIFILAVPLMARDMENFERTVQGDNNIKEVRFNADLGVGEIDLVTHKGGPMITCKAYYDADKIDFEFDYETDGDVAEVSILAEHYRKHTDIDTEDNELFISLSQDYDWNLIFDIGAADVTMDLTSLPLNRLNIDMGAGDTRIEFKDYNPLRSCAIDIDAGAGELKAFGLGYANFKYCNFDGGAGEFLLNFKGLKGGHRSMEVDIGVGEATLEIPRDFPLRLEASDGWLSSIDIERGRLNQLDDDIYETDDYRDSSTGLDAEVDVGIGQVNIEWIN